MTFTLGRLAAITSMRLCHFWCYE